MRKISIAQWLCYVAFFVFMLGCKSSTKSTIDEPISISGIYPSLASYNSEGECGTGAVVPWADKLWVITYGPHRPYGSSDKLYEVSSDYTQIVREESVGGTPANRLIHKESNQLFIGPYAIDSKAAIRVIPYTEAPGRYTGAARHLTDPTNKIYIGTMEEGFYEINTQDLKVNELFKDRNVSNKEYAKTKKNPPVDLLYGDHGKGLYSGQGVLVYSNNGELSNEAMHQFDAKSGSLSEWDGKEWKLIRRNQFTEITGPGGIYGNSKPESDPIWAVGWDHKSLILAVREPNIGWSFFRLPKTSHSYDGAHGWNTEWPRIRNIGTEEAPDYLMTMHGMFWKFPETFTSKNAKGIRPRSAYLKVIGDYARWNNQLVFGCDDSAQSEFLNKRKAKGNIGGPGQSNSNLWFTSFTKPDELGPTTAEGAVWINDPIKANEYSEPFIFSGWKNRGAWIENNGNKTTLFTIEVDKIGDNTWSELKTVELKQGESISIDFSDNEQGEWVRIKPNMNTVSTASFSYKGEDNRTTEPNKIFAGLTSIENNSSQGGLLYSLGNDRRTLGLLATTTSNGNNAETGYYELDDKLELIKKDDEETANIIRDKFQIPKQVIKVDKGSILIVDDKQRRWRLPLGNDKYTDLTDKGELRICREVATERDLFSSHGTFYELPAENADGYAKIRPIASHNFRINDYASYRGMLVITGITTSEAKGNNHIIVSDDKKAAVWVGVIDDLWSLGKPIGHGGPWIKENIKRDTPSDPYLMASYNQRSLTLSHDAKHDIKVKVEMDPTGNGDWMLYELYTVKSGEKYTHQIPNGIQAQWIRFTSDSDAIVTTWLDYK